MKLNLLILASLLSVTVAQADDEENWIPPWRMQKINATEWTDSGASLRAFNLLQDKLGRPHVDKVWYDFDSDFFHWRGPKTGKRMTMSREQFFKDILFPYLDALP